MVGLDKNKGGAVQSGGSGGRDHANNSPYSDTWEYLEDGEGDGDDDGDDGAYIDEAYSDDGEREYSAYDQHGSMKTLILESRLGEDFLSLFAPHPDI